ncbi:MAG: hypothetical protein ABUL48_04905 [Pseudorhodoplanes sp.]
MMMIASRVLTLRSGKEEIKIPIQIFAPQREKPGAWGCRYEVGWPEGKRSVTACGIDSIQAITIALGMIGAEIYTSNYHKSGNLFWDVPGKGYGFPVASSLRDLLIGDDAKYF